MSPEQGLRILVAGYTIVTVVVTRPAGGMLRYMSVS